MTRMMCLPLLLASWSALAMGANIPASGQGRVGGGSCLQFESTDYSGFTIGNRTVDHQEECADFCGQDEKCKFWTFREADQICLIKTSDAGKKKMQGHISGSRACGTGHIHFSNDLDILDELSEEEFIKYFHKHNITDPVELEKRKEALKKNEAKVKEANEKFVNGSSSYFDGIYSFSDLTKEEFMDQKTGLGLHKEYGRGLILPPMEERYNPVAEAWFDQLRFDRSAIPASFSSVDQGWVTDVKSQQTCGSCAAFAAVGAMEICFAKVTGVHGDYSEQQLMDCGYGYKGANGCNGALPDSYFKFIKENNLQLAHESQAPYKNKQGRCSSNTPSYNQGAKVTGEHTTYKGDEELIKKLVYKYGSCAVGVQAGGTIQEYKGGIFTGCPNNPKPDHAVVVVGYGTENGQDYWLIKNSWGKKFGENGYLRMIRGVNHCGIGDIISAVTCEATQGPTDRPMTTEYPCIDSLANDMSNPCPQYAQTRCWEKQVQKSCEKSCRLCPGMVPVSSYNCYDTYSNCGQLCNTQNAAKCKRSCGGCTQPTMVPLLTTPRTNSQTKPPVTQGPKTCSCKTFVDGNGFGNCDKAYNGRTLCYVNTPSSCGDLVESDGKPWSFEACAGTETVTTKPPVTQPPVTKPPVTKPPVTRAPVTQPPVTQAPVTQPPRTQPPRPQPTQATASPATRKPDIHNPDDCEKEKHEHDNDVHHDQVMKGINIFYSNVDIHA